MKRISKLTIEVAVTMTEKFVSKNVNSACLWCFYQERLPESCKKFKKVK